jgi:small subunit ribosomal protein S21
MEVMVHNGDMDTALRELKRKMLRDGIFRTLKDREAKASVRRRNKKAKELRRLKKQRMRRPTPMGR